MPRYSSDLDQRLDLLAAQIEEQDRQLAAVRKELASCDPATMLFFDSLPVFGVREAAPTGTRA